MAMDKNARIFVAGHRGMVGRAIVRHLQALGCRNLITRTRAELDLTNQAEVEEFFQSESIDQVYLAAARVGGIHANATFPAEFIYENLMIEANVIQAARLSGVKKLLFLGSSCIYPKYSGQPIKEEYLLTGALEPTNEPYAVAKIAGIKLCESYNRQYGIDFRSVMPTNLYGPGDNYHLTDSHVVPALLRRFHDAKVSAATEVSIWGTGNQRREFLYVDDMAVACVEIMELSKPAYDSCTEAMQSHINVGFGDDIPIRELAELIAEVVEFKGEISFDTTKPDGTPKKLLDSSKLRELGIMPSVPLRQGLEIAYADFLIEQHRR